MTRPTVIAEGVTIMWESTDTEVQSWFDHYQGSGSLSMAGSISTPLTTSPPPTQSVATSIATSTKTSSAPDRGRGNNLSVAALGALLLIAVLLISS